MSGQINIMGKIAKQTLSYDPVPQQTTISLLRGFLTISGKYKSEKIRSEGTVVGNRETSNTDYDIPDGCKFLGLRYIRTVTIY